ncbi:MAG: acylphosphatase [Candidatus Dadabacteria bacterium]
MPTIRVKIEGRVQGVYFRASAREMAEQLGLKGWVRNTEEGDVEAEVSGDEDKIWRFVEWCRQGPPRAIVSDVKVSRLEEQFYYDFKVIRGT